MGYRVVVVGATGNVGREMLQILSERQFPLDEVARAGERAVLVVGALDWLITRRAWLSKLRMTKAEVKRELQVKEDNLRRLVPGMIGAVSLATIWVRPEYMQRWFSGAGLIYSVTVPLLLAGIASAGYSSEGNQSSGVPLPYFSSVSALHASAL